MIGLAIAGPELSEVKPGTRLLNASIILVEVVCNKSIFLTIETACADCFILVAEATPVTVTAS